MRTFPHQFGDVMDILQTMLPQADDAGTRERVHAAMLAHAAGDVDRLLEATVLAQTDWRDMLMAVPEFAMRDGIITSTECSGQKTKAREPSLRRLRPNTPSALASRSRCLRTWPCP